MPTNFGPEGLKGEPRHRMEYNIKMFVEGFELDSCG